MNEEQKQAAIALQKEWGLIDTGLYTEQQILEQLALKLASIVAQGPDAFFQLMYRLDISEKKLVDSMHDKDVALKIAKLVYDRQLQKQRSREYYKNRKDEDTELKW